MTFFQGQMAFTRCILFTRFTREQNTTCKGHLAFQKVIYSRESAIYSFSYPNIHSFYYECRKGIVKQITDLTSDNYLKDVFINLKVEISYSCY